MAHAVPATHVHACPHTFPMALLSPPPSDQREPALQRELVPLPEMWGLESARPDQAGPAVQFPESALPFLVVTIH